MLHTTLGRLRSGVARGIVIFQRTSLKSTLENDRRAGQFDLITSAEQLDEIARVTRYPKIRSRIIPASAGLLINELREIAVTLTNLPAVEVCTDPDDNYLLAIAEAGSADFLVTGDKRDLLGIKAHAGARILTVRNFLATHGRLP